MQFLRQDSVGSVFFVLGVFDYIFLAAFLVVKGIPSSDFVFFILLMPLEEYVKALDRSKGELYYNHSHGMRYSKVTEQIYMGSCIQTEADIETLSDVASATAVLNFQSGTEAENWGIDSTSINESCQRSNILLINYPIRDGDSFDMRKMLPFCVGHLLRLLKKNHRVFVTCTTGFDRSLACVIAYLYWMTDTFLHAAYNFVTGLHSCRPDRPAIVWATWDLLAMVEKGSHDGPATHAVTFVWNELEGQDVNLVAYFTGNWKEPIKAIIHKGGPRYEVEVKTPARKERLRTVARLACRWAEADAVVDGTRSRMLLTSIIILINAYRNYPTSLLLL